MRRFAHRTSCSSADGAPASKHSAKSSNKRRGRRLSFELLEDRSLLSASAAEPSLTADAGLDRSTLTRNQLFVADVYRDVLSRTVDPSGLAYWDAQLAAGLSRGQMAFEVKETFEFANRQIERLYQRYLHRAADADGLNLFSSQLLAGVRIEAISADLAGSNEFFFAQGGGTNDGFLNAVYEDALGRPIDPAGLAWWTAALSLGASRIQVAAQILGTQEYRQVFVQNAYLQLLHRQADPAGLNHWVTLLNSGGTGQLMYSGIAGSQEFFGESLLALPTVTSLGTATDYSLFNADVPVTAGAAVAANNTILVAIASDVTASAVTVTDDRGNVYAQDVNVTDSGKVETWIFSAPVAMALAAGDHIIAHFAGAPPNAKAVSAISVTGLVRSDKVDQTHTNAGNSRSPNSGLTDPTQHPEELLIGALGVEGPNTDAFTAGAGYTLVGRAGTNSGSAGSNVTIYPEFQAVSAMGQYAANGSLGPTRHWAAGIATYKTDTVPVIAQPSDQTNTEGAAANLQIVASDSDGESLVYSATSLPPGLSINSTTGLITGSVGNTFANHGPYSVSVTATDPDGLSDTKSFAWNVINVAPAVINHSLGVTEAVPMTLPAPGVLSGSSDPGNESLQAVLDAGPSHGALTFNANGSFTYTSTLGFHGTDWFTYHAFDGVASGNVATVSLLTNDVTPPVVTPTANQANNENDAVSLLIVATDPEPETLFYSATGLPDGLSINSSTGLITGTIAGTAADHAPFSVDVAVSDGVNTTHDLFTWTVNNVAPLLAANDVSLVAGIAKLVTVGEFTDIGGPEPIGNYSATIDWGDGTAPSAGTISLAGGTFTAQGNHTYANASTPDHTGGLGYYVVTLTVVDNNGFSTLSSTATSRATVSERNVTPHGGFTVTATAGQSSGLQTVATFIDPGGPDPLTDYSATIDWADGTPVSPGTITLAAGTFTVQGSHTYAATGAGTYILHTTIRHLTAPDAIAVSEALVAGETPNQRFIAQVYLDFLGRPVDPAGLAKWDAQLAAGQSRQQVVFAIEQTLEYAQDTVNRLYQQYLRRNADPASLSNFSNLLLAGSTNEQISALLAGSNEYFFAQGGGTVHGFLNALYQDALGRPIDPIGLQFWDFSLALGLTRTQVAFKVMSGQEYRQDFVQQAYQQLLSRPADPTGLDGWVNVLNSGGTDQLVDSGIAGSQEYFDKAQT